MPKRIQIAQKRTIFYKIKTHPPEQQCLCLWLQVLDCFGQHHVGGGDGRTLLAGVGLPAGKDEATVFVIGDHQHCGRAVTAGGSGRRSSPTPQRTAPHRCAAPAGSWQWAQGTPPQGSNLLWHKERGKGRGLEEVYDWLHLLHLCGCSTDGHAAVGGCACADDCRNEHCESIESVE